MNGDHNLPRRSFLALAAWSLASCGGGSGGFAGLPGTGGTGITSFGSISGFGSVIVNSIKFDDLQSSIHINGESATSADLRIGMVANVRGVRGTTTSLGTANSIEVWSIAQGAVSQVSAGQFKLAGMTLLTNGATVFDGLGSAAALAPGVQVTVWGLQATADASNWTTTRVAVSPASSVVGSGLVQVVNSQISLNGLILAGSLIDSLKAGQLVRIQGTLSLDGTSLLVTRVKILDTDMRPNEGEAEVEGLITSLLSATRFQLGSIEVDASAASFEPLNLQLVVGTRVEVHGNWQAGVLKAYKVEAEDEDSLGQVEIEAQITEFTSLSNFVVRSQRCDASGVTTVKNGTLSDIKLGAKVSLAGTVNGNVFIVSRMEIVD